MTVVILSAYLLVVNSISEAGRPGEGAKRHGCHACLRASVFDEKLLRRGIGRPYRARIIFSAPFLFPLRLCGENV